MVQCSAGDLSSVVEADSTEPYGCRENVSIVGVDEEQGEDIFAKVVSVAEKAGASITKNDVSICNRLPSGGTGPKPLIAMFVRRETKHQLKKNKRNLKTPTSLSMMIPPRSCRVGQVRRK